MPTARFNLMAWTDHQAAPVTVRTEGTPKITCTGCHYHGPAKVITGRTRYPLYLCPKCNRVVQEK